MANGIILLYFGRTMRVLNRLSLGLPVINTITGFLSIVALSAMLVVSPETQASFVRWELNNAKFDDGTELTGWFLLEPLDPDGNSSNFIDFDIKSRNGPYGMTGYEYTPASVTYAGQGGGGVILEISEGYLAFGSGVAFTQAGGLVPFNPGVYSDPQWALHGSYEIRGGATTLEQAGTPLLRVLTTGSAIGVLVVPVPVPASALFFLVGFALLLCIQRQPGLLAFTR
ncbi:hypothetical protein GO003_000500 [Methylicorpusculum oleiharenae]|uniref:hypothetical protein n=1 Tax=Methylicorpusculum oleiharenae TaxID=1338687 RepID=UPI00135A0190|nr:hypothetical protein [Methylicorpusculum oleiharenae]MCD2448880.1 hypothetical protein [Methylicorpusculum oleiharenae]